MDRAMTAGAAPAPNKLLPILAHFPQLSVIPAYVMGVALCRMDNHDNTMS